jgi:hypothetical protein
LAAEANAGFTFQSRRQILQNPAKPAQAPAKFFQEKELGFAWISLSEMSLFKGLRRPPRHFFFFGRLRRIKAITLAYNACARLLPASGAVIGGGGAIAVMAKGIAWISIFRKDLSLFVGVAVLRI